MEVLVSTVGTLSKAEIENNFEELYETAFPQVAGFVSQLNGSFQDAKDIFQDALVIYMEKTAKPEFIIQIAAERYILGIAKHLWLRKFKADRNKISLDRLESAISIPEDFYPSIQSSRILRLLEITGKRCLDLLRGFYFERLTVKELTESFGYSSEHSATVQKFKCLEKIREIVKLKSFTNEDFYE